MSSSSPSASAAGLPEQAQGPEWGPLLSDWLPALPGVVPRLEQGAQAAEVGCGFGAAILLLARRFPRSSFIGFDGDPAAIDIARERACQWGVTDRVSFEVARSSAFPGSGYQLICSGLHGAADPTGSAPHVRRALAPAGTWLLVEPLAPSHARLRELLSCGGFSRFRRVAQTSLLSIFEARA
ncbi:MAG TPA: methyltransferase domain-containing protein [Polyangiaceae bacterium]|nr:methyltransferase domain-containing protein [Polyangiaceae bacterium]